MFNNNKKNYWERLADLTATPSFGQPADPHIRPFLSLTHSVTLSFCIVVVSVVSYVDLVSTYPSHVLHCCSSMVGSIIKLLGKQGIHQF